jgi:polysaccharide biosynthesis protein PslG
VPSLDAVRTAFLALVCLLAAVPAAHAALPPGFVGIYSDDVYFADQAYRENTLSIQAHAGIQTIRQPFNWSDVERSPGQYDFSNLDAYLVATATAGINVLPFVVSPPAWYSSKPANSTSKAQYPPKSIPAYASFVSTLVKRYGPNGVFWFEYPNLPYRPIRAWQVWNEPNIRNWWGTGVNARAYVKLLRATAKAIRAADPKAEVVSAGLPYSKNLGVPFPKYLNEMYRAGAKGLFDTLAIHAYSPNVQGLLALAESARKVMNHWHDRSKLWITEFGWSTAGDASAFRVTPRGQAQRISAALSGLAAERNALRLRGFILFKWRDAVPPPGLGSNPWPLHAGLVLPNGTPKPSYNVFRRVVAALRSKRLARGGSAAGVEVSSKTLRLSPLGFAAVTLGCRSRRVGACGGVLRLRAAQSAGCRGAYVARGATLGRTSFRIAVAPAVAPVHLNVAARKVIACAGQLRVRAGARKSVELVVKR